MLAGRRGDAVRALAFELNLDHRAFGLEDRRALMDGLDGIAAVLHAAGPFSTTARPMAQACIATSTHYCDITGEIDVFEDLAALDDPAKAAEVTLLPGAGFDVVPSDCLAAHVAARMPDAVRLRLSIGGLTRASRGTAKTMVEGIARGTRVRSEGRLLSRRGTPRGTADFGAGPQPTVGVSWGDVSTAWRSTGIPDIEVFFEADRAMRAAANLPTFVKAALGTGTAQRILKAQVDRRLPPGPTPMQRAYGRAVIVAETWDAADARIAARMSTPEPYALTAETAVETARRLAKGRAPTGFQTPSGAFGADFVLEFVGVEREDL